MPKLIEIIGAPGSGKTFLCNKLQKIKIKNKQIFFHSGQKQNFNKFLKLNFLSKILISLKVLVTMLIFYLFFFKRIFLKKIYKKKFFFRVSLLIFIDLVSIETLKKTLSNDKFILMEPGIVMHFLQDYFYTFNKISKTEIKIFNKLFLNTNYVIFTNSNLDLIKKRLDTRKRGVPQRMMGLNLKDRISVINKSIFVIKNYISNIKTSRLKIIKINTSNSLKKIKNNFLNLTKKT